MIRREEHECPLCGERFFQEAPASGSSCGMWLDFQLAGAVASPRDWPECPKDGFILHREFSWEEVETLRPFIASWQYQTLRGSSPQYWRIDRMEKELGVPLRERADILLQTTWQASQHNYTFFAGMALKAFRERMASSAAGGERRDRFVRDCMVTGELYRRLGFFDKAEALFARLVSTPQVATDAFCRKYVERQLHLIGEQDDGSRLLDDALTV
ncbi:hypothetical protein LJC23_00915 [Desulfovibrio sp. OttesenSCG-928-I05]|nr:hypothetical protein [Desulfovibrio sp. OttesenSCG-928-I05]